LSELAEQRPQHKPALDAARRRLIGFGIAKDQAGELTLQPLRPTAGWTAYELCQLERYHAELLARLVLDGAVTASFQANFTDPRLTLPKSWRDVYRYDPQGRPLGWTRYDGAGPTDFSPDGLIALERDALGRCVKGRTVRYHQEPSKAGPFQPRPLRIVPGDEVLTFEYTGDDDFVGRPTSRQKLVKP
jgi:hypothetical protein